MKRILTSTLVVAASLLLLGQANKPDKVSPVAPSEIRVVPAESSPATQALEARERDWANAVKQRDVEQLARLEGEEFEFTDPSGQVWSRTRQLETLKAGDLQIDSFEISEFKARIYGDTAVVRFRIQWNGRFRDADISGPQRVTDVWVKRDGRWLCVASHAVRIAAP